MALVKKARPDIRTFKIAWTKDYGFIPHNGRAMCSLCRESIVCRTSGVKRHFETKHVKSFKDDSEKEEAIRRALCRYELQRNNADQKLIPDECKLAENCIIEADCQDALLNIKGGRLSSDTEETDKESVFERVLPLDEQLSNNVPQKPNASKNRATEASYRVAQCIAKHGKPFTDGDYIKEALICSSEVLFEDLPNKDIIISRINEMPLSARTIKRRISEMAANVCEQQTMALKSATVFSVALDECVDVNGGPRLAIVARYSDTEIHEELCCLKSLPGNNMENIAFMIMTEYFEEKGIDMRKIFALTTGGAPAMLGNSEAFARLIEAKIGHPVINLPCIIHQESLCAKISNFELNEVMTTMKKILNFLVGHSALTHGQIRSLLEETENAYGEVPLHCSITWLSHGKVLEQFVECLDEIKTFLAEKGQNYPELENEEWIVRLMFLADITTHLNELNHRLQGVGQTVLGLYEIWKTFVAKFAIFLWDIQTASFQYFKQLKRLSTQRTFNIINIGVYMHELGAEFSSRFQDFQHFGPMFSYLIQPDKFEKCQLDISMFEWMEIRELEMQLIDFQASSLWSAKFADLRKLLEMTENNHGAAILTCWTSLPDKFACLKKVALALLSAFGSACLSEQIFSHMKFILSPLRSRLASNHIQPEGCVQLKVSRYAPEISTLSKGKQGQGSH